MSNAPADIAAARAARAWRSGLILTPKTKEPKRTLGNTMHVLATHPAWTGVLAYDEFGQTVVTRRTPPMRPQDAIEGYAPGDWSDNDTARSCAWFGAEVEFEPTVAMVDQAVSAIAHKCIIHPVRDWLLTLAWDGTKRLDSFVAEYLGGARSAYSAAVGRKWLIAAVARAMAPGCKVDSVLVLEGLQGIGKSSALRMLAGAQWFADTGIEIGNKDSLQTLRRKWIYEFSEMASIRGREIERVKNFVSSQVDSYRPSYGRRTQDYPRQVVFAGSTNDSTYLSDPTGARRFWPVACAKIDLEFLARDREQLWAEARAAYEAGEAWHLDSTELQRLAALEAQERAEQDDWGEITLRWLAHPTRPDGHSGRDLLTIEDGITTADVLLGALSIPASQIAPAASKRAGHVLRALGFQRIQVRQGSHRQWRYFRSGDTTGDTESAENTYVSPVTDTFDAHTHKGDHSNSSIGKPAVTPVTGDTGEDIERAAIQDEPTSKTQQTACQPPSPEGGAS